MRHGEPEKDRNYHGRGRNPERDRRPRVLVERPESNRRRQRGETGDAVIGTESSSGTPRSKPGHERTLGGFGETGDQAEGEKGGNRRPNSGVETHRKRSGREEQSPGRDQTPLTDAVGEPTSRIG